VTDDENTGPTVNGTVLQNEDGKLTGGNVQIHKTK